MWKQRSVGIRVLLCHAPPFPPFVCFLRQSLSLNLEFIWSMNSRELLVSIFQLYDIIDMYFFILI